MWYEQQKEEVHQIDGNSCASRYGAFHGAYVRCLFRHRNCDDDSFLWQVWEGVLGLSRTGSVSVRVTEYGFQFWWCVLHSC